jgi:glucose-6-phosphate 1-epimerase
MASSEIFNVYRLGAQLYAVNFESQFDWFYLSPQLHDRSTNVRGGVPILFPQFATDDSLDIPKHGWARQLNWQLVSQSTRNVFGTCDNHGSPINSSKVVFQLEADDHSLAKSHPGAKLQLTIFTCSEGLRITLQVSNCGTKAWQFSGGLHPYLFTGQINSSMQSSPISISTKHPQKYTCRLTHHSGQLLADHSLELKNGQELQLHGTQSIRFNRYDGVTLDLSSTGFSDWVIWSPGYEGAKNLKDLPIDDWSKFVCIEPVWLGKRILEPKSTISATLNIKRVKE